MNKSAAIRDVAADMPGASASGIADEIRARFGIEVTPGSVRAVRSRDATRGVPPSRPGAVRAPYRPRKRAVPDDAGYAASGEPDDYDDDSGDGYRRPPARLTGFRPAAPPRRLPAFRPATPVMPVQAPEFDDDALDRMMDAVDAAVKAAAKGNPQATTGDREYIRNAVAIANDPALRSANMPFTMSVTDNPDGSQTLTIRGSGSGQVRNPAPRRRKPRETGCEWCYQGNRQSMPGANLYLVSSPVIGRQIILCQLHAEVESRVPGTVVIPYRVFDQFSGAQVIMPPIPEYVRKLREAAQEKLVAYQSLLGNEENLWYRLNGILTLYSVSGSVAGTGKPSCLSDAAPNAANSALSGKTGSSGRICAGRTWEYAGFVTARGQYQFRRGRDRE